MALLFRDAAGTKVQKNTDGTDTYIPIYAAGSNNIQFTTPFIQPTANISNEPITATVGQSFSVSATASSIDGTLNLYYNGNKIAGPLTGTNVISAAPTVAATGNQLLISELVFSGNSYYDTLQFYVTPTTVVLPLPDGVQEGINYYPNGTSATLVLFAPNKTSAVVIGDLPGSNWVAQTQYQMNKTPDGKYYWITINNLVSGFEYSYQYLVDNSIYIADPYSEKILDPYNDPYIPVATYPNLKPYPTNANVSAGKNGTIGILQTNQPAYNWKVNSFVKPDKRNLMTYELLVRDFGDAKNYQMLIDTISYFKRLGVNAIELMPVNEFAGNESWGYNPTFYCALDKAYGTKNKFKEFIDLCHQNGIAIILDVVYNHMDAYSTPQGRLYWNSAAGQPAANSPWFNTTAPHPYSVFEDFNHTTAATQYLVERAMNYWIAEYKVDGYRFDLAKGFTQTASTTTTVENFDISRVVNLERYYDYLIPKYPDTYMILEFLGQQRAEEQEYAKHGFMLWGNNNATYNQCTMGYATNSNFSKIAYNSSEEAFTTPAEMGYMESHDEERLMYRNLNNGNASGSYNVKTLATALERQAAAASVFFTVPGPKMIWQFGERGYDVSIGFGGGNTSNKPPHWEYMQDANRLKLWDVYSKLINLRLVYPATFNNTTFSYDFANSNLVRRFQIADPNGTGLKVTVIANFNVVAQTVNFDFQSTGTWYNFISNGTIGGLNGVPGSSFNVATNNQTVTLQPGEYHVYLDRQAILPLSLLSFTGQRNAASLDLNWATDKEVNVKQFEVERSLNGTSFSKVATVKATNTSNSKNNYTFADQDNAAVKATGKVYYRLHILDKDGKESYSDVVAINPIKRQFNISLYPNPVVASSQLYIQLDAATTSQQIVRFKIEDVSGRLYQSFTVNAANYSNGKISVDVKKLAAGTYILKAESSTETSVKQFVIATQ